MPQKAKVEEKTLLELVSGGKLRTSEDIPELSESEIFSEWVLPAVTGASAETDEYQPGALDLALTVPVVGGSLKTGLKLAKQVGKKLSKAYKGSVRPKVFPEKHRLLASEITNTEATANLMDDELLNYYTPQSLGRQVEQEGYDAVLQRIEDDSISSDSARRAAVDWINEFQATRTTPVTPISERIPRGYQRGTYARQQASEELPPGYQRDRYGIIEDASIENTIFNEAESSFQITRAQSSAIAEDIGIEGWDRFTGEIRALPPSERRAFADNFMAKYKEAGVISGDKAIQTYKSKKFKFNVEKGEKTFKWVNEKRGTEHTLKQMSLSPRSTKYELKIKRIKKPGDPPYSLKGNPASSLSFYVNKITDDVYGKVHEISHISFFASGGKRADMYSGRLLNDLLDKLPENAVINETSMTFDSFYMMINQAIKKKASIVFDEGKRIPFPISPSSRSKWSKDIKNAQTVSERNEIIDGIMNQVRLKLKDYPKLEGRPKLSAEGVDIEFNRIKIHNITAALAVALGLKNKEQLEKLLAHDSESVESQIFDNDFSI